MQLLIDEVGITIIINLSDNKLPRFFHVQELMHVIEVLRRGLSDAVLAQITVKAFMMDTNDSAEAAVTCGTMDNRGLEVLHVQTIERCTTSCVTNCIIKEVYQLGNQCWNGSLNMKILEAVRALTMIVVSMCKGQYVRTHCIIICI